MFKTTGMVFLAVMLVYAGIAWALEDCPDEHSSVGAALESFRESVVGAAQSAGVAFDFGHGGNARIHCVVYAYPLIMAVEATKASSGKEFGQPRFVKNHLSREWRSALLAPYYLRSFNLSIFDLSPPVKTSRHLVFSVLTI